MVLEITVYNNYKKRSQNFGKQCTNRDLTSKLKKKVCLMLYESTNFIKLSSYQYSLVLKIAILESNKLKLNEKIYS